MVSTFIHRVAIVGGTHGNERTGVYLVRKFQQFPHLIQRSTFECITLLANPKAVAANQRYLARDLNRCFAQDDLQNPHLNSYEDQLAKAIAQQLVPNDQPKVDLIIDLHSTTANMGLTILPTSNDPFNLRLSAYLITQHPQVRICCGLQYGQQSPMLRSLVPLGCTIEVGAIAQGVLDAEKFQQTEQLIYAVLDYLEAVNQENLPPVPSSIPVYQVLSSVDYPRHASGDLKAMIHPQRQFQDYEPLQPGDPMFLSFTGETISYEGKTTLFPVFINEAAYYEKGIAMYLTEKRSIQVDSTEGNLTPIL